MYSIGWFFGGCHFPNHCKLMQTLGPLPRLKFWICSGCVSSQSQQSSEGLPSCQWLWPICCEQCCLWRCLFFCSHTCPCICCCCCSCSLSLSLFLVLFLVLFIFLVLAVVLSPFHVFFRIDVTWLYRSHPEILSCTTPLYQIRSSSHIASIKSPER